MRRSMSALVVGAGLAFGTGAGAGEVRLGVWAGPNLATLQIEDAPEDAREKRTAAAFGSVLAFRFAAGWSLELRPSHVGRGAKIRIAGSQSVIQGTYVEFPLLITRELGAGRVRPYLLAGVALARRSSAKAVSGTHEQDISDDFEGSDASLRAGAGMRFRSVAAQPFLEVEYTHGFKDLNARGGGLGSAVGAIRNRGLQLRGGISFGIGKH